MKFSKILGMLGVFLLAFVPGQNLVWGQTPTGTCQDVSESSSYTLVYELNIPLNANYNNTLPLYTINESASITAGGFDRVAYCMQLNTDYVWVSMDTFTPDPVKIGVPVISTGETFQQIVSNMNVFSNVPSIVSGTEITTGNIEFWHNCYSPANYKGSNLSFISGASSNVYDFGDFNSNLSPSPAISCFGSMQVHNHGTEPDLPQTLFAYNAWDIDEVEFEYDDLGIGTNTVVNPIDDQVNPDWTYRQNTASYATKILKVYVSSGIVPFDLTILDADVRVKDKPEDNRMNFEGTLDLAMPFGPDNVEVSITSSLSPGFNSIDTPVTLPAAAFTCDLVECTARVEFASQLFDTADPDTALSVEVILPVSGTGSFDVSIRNIKTVASAVDDITLTLKIGDKTGVATVEEFIKDLGKKLTFPDPDL